MSTLKAQPDIQNSSLETVHPESHTSTDKMADRIADLEMQLASMKAFLEEVLESRGWRLLSRYRQLKRRFGTTWLAGLIWKLAADRRESKQQAAYVRWISLQQQGSAVQRPALEFWKSAVSTPKMTVLITVRHPDSADVSRTLDSLRSQIFDNWEAIIVITGPSNVGPVTYTDGRVRSVIAEPGENLASVVERALISASGEYVAVINAGDELSPTALHEVGRGFLNHPTFDVIYTDEDQLDQAGRRCHPFFKPDWSPEYFLSTGYIGDLTVYRKNLLSSTEAMPHDLSPLVNLSWMLSCFDRAREVGHIPKVLCHRAQRSGENDRPGLVDDKYVLADVVRKGLGRLHSNWTVGATAHRGVCRVQPPLEGEPLVSVIIPTKDNARMLRRAISSIERKTAYRRFEILIVDNNSSRKSTRNYLASLPYRVLHFSEPFNYSRINNFAGRHASGSYLLFLNDDVTVINPEWLTAMLEYCQLPEVGAVGAKLYYRSGLIQHGGIILGMGGVAENSHRRLPHSSSGYHSSLVAVRNYSAVTAACMMVRKEVFDRMQGFNEDLAVAFNDVDFCLRLRQDGFRIVWTPYAELYHYESASRGYSVDFKEISYIRQHWQKELARDPYYNPNLSLARGDFRLALT